jgi:hypothetical protein
MVSHHHYYYYYLNATYTNTYLLKLTTFFPEALQHSSVCTLQARVSPRKTKKQAALAAPKGKKQYIFVEALHAV